MRRWGIVLVGVLAACGRTETYSRSRPDASIPDAGAAFDAGCSGGCSDGTREGFVDACRYRDIAACSGGFSVPGVFERVARCDRSAGDSSLNPDGRGCAVEDLCELGWHVCRSPGEVMRASVDGCAPVAGMPMFFITGQTGTGCGVCSVEGSIDPVMCTGATCAGGCQQTALTANDVFGCGGIGDPPAASCGVLNRFGNNLCGALGEPWSCPSANGETEAHGVVKASAAGGGALCCR